MSCEKKCDNNTNTESNYLIIIVLYILLAIILGSLIIY